MVDPTRRRRRRERREGQDAGDPGGDRSLRSVAVVGTVPRAGRTLVAGAIARWIHDRPGRAGVFLPVATGCRRQARLGLVSADAEFLAHCADAPYELATVNPVRFADSLVPAECARRTGRSVDFDLIEQCRARIAGESDLVVMQIDGGLLDPLDATTTYADLLVRWNAPLIVVSPARADLARLVLLTLSCARSKGLTIQAVVLNRYDADRGSLAEELNPEVIARYADVELPVVVPIDAETDIRRGRLGRDVMSAIRPIAASVWAASRA